jgi:hypothetical protein
MVPKKKHQVFKEHPKDLVCDTCPERSPWMDTEGATVDRAVFKGWRVFKGPGLTGKPLNVACCPGCFRTGAPARPSSAAVMEGQEDLLGLITPVPVPKKTARSGKRQMS